MKSLSPYVLAKRNLAMTIVFMAVMTFLTILKTKAEFLQIEEFGFCAIYEFFLF